MFPHKKDQSFISVPVSRVGLSNRLNQLNLPNTNGSGAPSRPGTPGASYVTSSLNPTKNLPISQSDVHAKINSQQELEKFDLLAITQSLRQFESTFSKLSQSISTFQEDSIAQNVEGLIHICQAMSNELNVLKKHLELGKEIDGVLVTRSELDNHTRHLLKELISCRAELKRLPKLPAAHDRVDPTSGINEVSVPEVIDYSMKLAKFSKAPVTVVSQIHPNNYIWPAEDALRRGMLAMASLKTDELIKAELGDSVPEADPKDVDMEDASSSPKKSVEPEPMKAPEPKTTTNLSDNHTVNAPAAEKKETTRKEEPVATSSALNLDLFDPDEDSDSD